MKTYFKILQTSTIVLFLFILFIPILNSGLSLIDEIEGREYRTFATKPEFNIDRLDSYTEKYDEYYSDNFNLRQNFIALNNRFNFFLFKTSPVKDLVTVGKGGWFYASKSIANYKAANLFSELQMFNLREELEARTNWAKERGVEYYIVLIPNKMTIYPEYIPRQVPKLSNITRYDQVLSLGELGNINIVDVRKNLLKHKSKKNKLYKKTDDHWNQLGAYYGYQEIFNTLSEKFPQLTPSPLSNYKISTGPVATGNMASILNLENYFSEHSINLTNKIPSSAKNGEIKGYPFDPRVSKGDAEFVKINNNSTNLSCLIIRDSFTQSLVRFFQEHFKKSVFIHDAWLYRMRKEIIEEENPDIVLNVILETELQKLLDYPFIKTAEHFYHKLSTDDHEILFLTNVAKKSGKTLDLATKEGALWYCDEHIKKNGAIKKTLFYYQLLYEVRDQFKAESESYAIENEVSFSDAVKILSQKAFETR